MKILVTGATGYLGSHVVASLVRSHTVYPVVRDPIQGEESRFSDCAAPVVWDLSRTSSPVSGMPEAVDCVLHMAQSRHYQDFPEKALDVVDINVSATARLLDYAARAGAKSFCFMSSGSVYEPYKSEMSETAALSPTSINGCTKAAAEMLLRAYSGQMDISILRLFMPYGPGQTNRLLPNLIGRIQAGEAVDLANGIGFTCAPLDITDVVRTVERAIEEGWTGTYNVAGAERLTLLEICTQIADRLGRPLIKNEPAGETPDLVPPLEKLSSKLELTEFKSFSEGLKAVLNGRS